MFGAHPHRLRVPVDLDALLINDTVQRQVSPTGLRNQSGDGGYFGIAPHNPVMVYTRLTPQTFGFAMQAPAVAPAGTASLQDDTPFADVGLAVRVGR